jgi:hypothetical protein
MTAADNDYDELLFYSEEKKHFKLKEYMLTLL